ncbi:hypothetical protein Tco_0123744 [Tanacetum coccineum]
MTSDVKDLKKSLAERESELLGLKDEVSESAPEEVSSNVIGYHQDDVCLLQQLTCIHCYPNLNGNLDLGTTSGNIKKHGSHAVEDPNGTRPNHVAPNIRSVKLGIPVGNCNQEKAEDTTVGSKI